MFLTNVKLQDRATIVSLNYNVVITCWFPQTVFVLNGSISNPAQNYGISGTCNTWNHFGSKLVSGQANALSLC